MVHFAGKYRTMYYLDLYIDFNGREKKIIQIFINQ